MRRVRVIGAPGTGKSTLALQIGRRLGLPVIHMDREFWRPGWVAPGTDEWRAQVRDLAGRESWVMEGNYSGTWELSLARAEAVIWLDLPRHIYFPRTIWRSIRWMGRQRPDLGAGCIERFDPGFYRDWVWTYPAAGPGQGRSRLLTTFAAPGRSSY